MAEASLLHVANSLLGKLTAYALEEIKIMWGAKEDLQQLVSTIDMIKAGLLDAEKRQESRDREGEHARIWLRRLRNVLYDADDLLEKVFSIERSKLALTGKEKLDWELSHFFSKSNSVYLRAEIARKVKKIRCELDDIESDMRRFKFDRSLLEKWAWYDRETGSMKASDEIIGREKEEGTLKGLLMDVAGKEEGLADVIAIVGFGGLGKTTLAQLLYNNKALQENFNLHAWACISNTKGTTAKARIILDALQTTETIGSSQRFSNPRNIDEVSIEKMGREIQARVKDKKYLLVIDDYWDEDRHTWLYLMGLLRGGKAGSKILVTTRSSKVAIAMGAKATHDLKGLADDKAWELFKRLAFRSTEGGEGQSLIAMGKEIVKKCKNVPLAITAIASLLYTFSDDERGWKSIMDSDMLTLERKHENLKILPILKLSYDHLPSHLKHCFAFCSLFPKDYKMSGEMLVDYWIAQGYVEEHCCDRAQSSLAEIGETCLKELTARSFLQRDPWGLPFYTMHDLMHDLAQAVAGEEVLAVNKDNFNDIGGNGRLKITDARIRHLSFSNVQIDDDFLTGTRAKYLRSFIHAYHSNDKCTATQYISETVFKKLAIRFSSLRLLDLRNIGLGRLPNSVGELKLLRCLLVSENRFKHIPIEITQLHNLRVLDVSECNKLETLPDNLNRLINLKCLRLSGCTALTGMECNIRKLSCLESLDCFMIRDYNTGLEAITWLVNLKGSLKVEYMSRSGGRMRKGEEEEERRVDLSSSIVHLDALTLMWPYGDHDQWGEGIEFECSQLPSNLKRLCIWRFPGQKLPDWEKGFNMLLHLYLDYCKTCQYLPSFGHHPRLRTLQLHSLKNLEYIQLEMEEFVAETRFPCLERLKLTGLPELKAWSPGMEKRGLHEQHIYSSGGIASFPRFHSLDRLEIRKCPNLTSMPLPPVRKGCRIYVDFSVKDPLRKLVCIQEKGE